MIGFNLDFVADPDDSTEEEEVEEEVEEVELVGSEIPLGSITFASCFDARTLQNRFKTRYSDKKMQPVDILFCLSHLLPPLENAVMQFERRMPF